LQRISTDDGITIDFKREYENTCSSIRINFESGSNKTDLSDLQYLKHDLQRISTDDGITIVFKPDDENADSSIRINFES
jgi:hypothetical protein